MTTNGQASEIVAALACMVANGLDKNQFAGGKRKKNGEKNCYRDDDISDNDTKSIQYISHANCTV